MQNSTPQKLDYVDRFIQKFSYWLFFILTIILCFGYFITNHSVGLNDLWINNYNLQVILYSGNLGNIFQYLIGFEYIPFFYEYLGIIIYAISITLTVKCFSRYIKGFTYKHSIIFACISVSFPFAAMSFMDIDNTINNSMSMLAGVSAAFFFCKYSFEKGTKKHLVLCCICLLYSISLCINGLIYYLICILFILFKNNIKVQKHIIKMIIIPISIINPYFTILVILKFIFKLDSLKFIDILRSDNNFFEEINDLLKNYIETLNNDFASYILGLSILILLFISIYMAIKRRRFITFLLGLFIIILPLTKFILTSDSNLDYNEYSTYGYVIAITVIMLYDIIGKDNVMRNILIAISILVILNNAREINKIFYIENLKFKNDLELSKFIMHDIEMYNLQNKKIMFLGEIDELNLPYTYEIENYRIPKSIFNANRDDNIIANIYCPVISSFFKENGYEILVYDEYPLKGKENILNTAKGMPKYPTPGYIRDMGDYVIIKLGNNIPENDYDE